MTDEQTVSKSELKRQAEALKQLGKKLCDLGAAQRARVPLPNDLLAAVEDYHRFDTHGAQRRQLQFIARLLRGIDTEPIQAAVAALAHTTGVGAYRHHQLESWRAKLLADSSALTAYVSEHPSVDVQTLRHLIRQARSAGKPAQQKTAARALFRFLRDVEDRAGESDHEA